MFTSDISNPNSQTSLMALYDQHILPEAYHLCPLIRNPHPNDDYSRRIYAYTKYDFGDLYQPYPIEADKESELVGLNKYNDRCFQDNYKIHPATIPYGGASLIRDYQYYGHPTAMVREPPPRGEYVDDMTSEYGPWDPKNTTNMPFVQAPHDGKIPSPVVTAKDNCIGFNPGTLPYFSNNCMEGIDTHRYFNVSTKRRFIPNNQTC